jgi:hypothetical protein
MRQIHRLTSANLVLQRLDLFGSEKARLFGRVSVNVYPNPFISTYCGSDQDRRGIRVVELTNR